MRQKTTFGISDLIKAIQAVHQGELWVERKLMARFFEVERRHADQRQPKEELKKAVIST